MNLFRLPDNAVALPDITQWTNRYAICSLTSSRTYIVAQNCKTRKWGCSCPGYIFRKKCKHLIKECGLSENQIHGNKKK